jgi:PAS domain S-box-containing protein
MVDAVRNGDYQDALQWLNTLAAVDAGFSLPADEVLASWRDRARRYRAGDVGAEPAAPSEPPADYRGLFAALLEHSHDGIVISEAESGWMLECSRSFVILTGYARHELLGRTSVELGLIDPEIRAAALESTRQTGAGGGFQTRLRCKDGEVRVVEFSPQLLAGQELLLTIVRDVTERHPSRPVSGTG